MRLPLDIAQHVLFHEMHWFHSSAAMLIITQSIYRARFISSAGEYLGINT